MQYSKLACRRRGEGGATAGAAGADFLTTTRSRERRIWKRDQANQDLPRPSSSPFPRLLCQHRRPPFYTAATITAFEKGRVEAQRPWPQRGTFQIFHVNYDLLYRRFTALHLGSWRLYRRKTSSVENFRPAELRRQPATSIRANPPAWLRLAGTSEECGEGAAPCV